MTERGLPVTSAGWDAKLESGDVSDQELLELAQSICTEDGKFTLKDGLMSISFNRGSKQKLPMQLIVAVASQGEIYDFKVIDGEVKLVFNNPEGDSDLEPKDRVTLAKDLIRFLETTSN